MGETTKNITIVPVGNQWMEVLQASGSLITDKDFYQSDHYHPTVEGSFFTAMVLVHELFKIDLQLLTEYPSEISREHFLFLKSKFNENTH